MASDKVPKLFGDVLRQERERLGLTIQQANEATRVREQILHAFENSDMVNLPPRGYARNMIGSYARFLGLDPRKVISIYEQNYAEWESGLQDDDYPVYDGSQTTRRIQIPQNNMSARHSVTSREIELYGANGNERDNASAIRRLRNANARAAEGYGHNGRPRRSQRIFSGGGDYTKGGQRNSTTRVIAIAVAVILLIVLGITLTSYVRSCRSSQQAAETPAVTTTPVEETSSAGTGTTTTTTSAVQPVTATVTVDADSSSTMTVTVDGAVAIDNQDIIGPFEESFTGSTQVQVKYTTPESVKVTYLDTTGETRTVTPVIDENGDASASIAVSADGAIVVTTDADAVTTQEAGTQTTGTTQTTETTTTGQ